LNDKDDGRVPDETLLERPKDHKGFNLAESMEKIASISRVFEPAWRYKFLDFQGVKEIKSPYVENGQPLLNLHSNVNRYVEEEGGAQIIFEFLQSKLKRTELFILFNLSFNPKTELIFLEMQVTPSSDKGVNFFIPF
jgi:hypothetical protein